MTCEMIVECGSPVGERPNMRETGSFVVVGGSAVAGAKPKSNVVATVMASLLWLILEFEAIVTADCTWDEARHSLVEDGSSVPPPHAGFPLSPFLAVRETQSIRD
ncbi:unnamed protein product [Cuscuta epithymum]|uniref:Uncharacterized protein n=1 Tax=Cuscuta epithymum TaxID=186058 RepID=A0AAV0G8B0_9ASTE|nr:unnamed protein product [Cuscuta epithymum]